MGYLYSLKKMVFWCIILLTMSESFVVRVHSQTPSTKGFISIDCGIASNTNVVDSVSGLTYVSDDQYTNTGINHKISSQYTISDSYKYLTTLRSFPDFTKNCYTLTPVTQGNKYLVRATFFYGNYDGLNKLPIFDMYLGVNFWRTVNLTGPDYFNPYEIITVPSDNYIEVCLVNTGSGTPLISALELRPLKTTMYPYSNSSQSLDLYSRDNFGSSNQILVRYPDDPFDRQWFNSSYYSWTELNTTSIMRTSDDFDTPSVVLQTAAVPKPNDSFDHSWTSDNTTTTFYIVLHFSEIESLTSKDLREFYIYANGLKVFDNATVLAYLESYWVSYRQTSTTNYNLSLVSTNRSTLPPIINAFEAYMVLPVILLPTKTHDVIAINAIKANYSVNKGWSGDPCAPTGLNWTGVSCTLTSSNVPRITGLNLASSGLTGAIISAFGDLISLKSLDLSHNKLSGSIPSSLEQLTSLTFLDLSGNTNLSTTLPSGLQKRQDTGQLTVKTTDAPNNCVGSGCDKKKSPIIIIVIVVVVLLLLVIAGAIVTLLSCKKNRQNKIIINAQNSGGHYGTTPLNGPQGNYAYSPNNVQVPSNNYGNNSNATHGNQEKKLHFESRQFTYKELQMITNNFQNNIGTGGFGSVFLGNLENGKQVAVKLRSDKSSQGFNEFSAEAKNLTKVHHKYLVSLVGYCMEGEYMALVYEYMPEGTLQDKLRDNARPLAWKQRLRIAHESAQGLEYLHKSCNPPLIHRDVKTNNILLTSNFEAKIADFGLVRAFDGDGSNSHVSTRIVGTPGYLDPDYYTTSQLSEKSDVYSFGVVLLEMVTGQPPIITGPQGGHLSHQVRQKLSKGNIESIVDQRMGNQYDINSIWKVAELGLRCTDQAAKRPTMTGVVAELKESLDLEMSSAGTYSVVSGSTSQYNYSRNDNLGSEVSNGSGFEMAYMGHVPDASGPAPR